MKIDRIKNTENNKYLLFYKPDGVICQFSEHEQHPSLAQFIPIKDVYPAGRLDTDSEGLLLLTNDGLLSHRLTDSRRHCPKVYYAQVEGDVSHEALKKLQRGVMVKGYQTLPSQVEKIAPPELPLRQKLITPHALTSWIRIILHEGKKRQIRHMTATVGFPTLRLIRVAIGPLNMKDLKPGQWRFLQNSEIKMLKTALRMNLAL
jgi:23S rRNA pseudouridine2457 synthase